MKIPLFLLLIFFLLSSCHKTIFSGLKHTSVNDSLLTDEVKIRVKETNYKYFAAKSKIRYQNGEEDINAVLQSRISKDSVIWFRLEKLSFEGLRALIRKDSLFLWEEQENKLQELSFDSLSRLVNFNLDFRMLQAALTGNMPLIPTSQDKFFKVKDEYVMRQTQGRIKVENYINEKTLKLTRLIVTETTTGNTLTIEYGEFLSAGTELFPYKIIANLTYKSRPGSPVSTLYIEHQKVDFPENEPAFSFNFEKYRKKDKKTEK
jgi:hypothetical protein